MRKVILFLSLFVFLNYTLGQDEIELAALFPLGGAHAAGELRYKSAEVAALMVNNDITTFDFDLKIILYEDNASVSLAIEKAYDSFSNPTRKKFLLGPNSSSQSVAVSHLAKGFQIPIISYASTAESLTNKNPHDFFFRTCPSDFHQVKTWISIMKEFNWKTCSIIASDDSYGSGNADSLRTQLLQLNITVDVLTIFEKGNASLTSHIENLKKGDSRIIFLLTEGIDGRNVIDAAIEGGIIGKDSTYTWILSEAIASIPQLYPDSDSEEKKSKRREALAGSLGTRPSGGRGELWEEFLELLESEYDIAKPSDVFVPYVVDAVFTLAHAIKNCREDDSCDLDDGTKFRNIMRNVNFVGTTGPVTFDENNDRQSSYDILNFVNDADEPIIAVGTWDVITDEISFEKDIIWPDGTTDVPSDIVTFEHYFNWRDTITIITIALVGFFILLTIATFAVVFYYSHTAIIRYSSPLFLYFILIGLVLIYLHLIFWFGKPNTVMCTLKVWIGFLGTTLVFSSQIAKTYRVYKIFKQRRRLKKIVMDNKRLLKFVGGFTLPTIIILSIWTGVDILKPEKFIDNSGFKYNIYCHSKTPSWEIISFLYQSVLIFATVFLSFQTRKIPDGFRESHWINLSSYNVVVCGIVGITMAYVLSKDMLATYIIIIIATLFGSLSLWGFLFLPKIYDAVTNKKIRKPTTSRLSGRTVSRTDSGSVTTSEEIE